MLHPSISRQHAVLVPEPGPGGVGVVVSLIDLDSSYGTKVSGEPTRVLQGTPVSPGARVAFGLSTRTPYYSLRTIGAHPDKAPAFYILQLWNHAAHKR